MFDDAARTGQYDPVELQPMTAIYYECVEAFGLTSDAEKENLARRILNHWRDRRPAEVRALLNSEFGAGSLHANRSEAGAT